MEITKHKEFSAKGILLLEGHYDNCKLKSGLWKEYNSEGLIVIEEFYQKGKRHGEYISYHDNGAIWCRGNFIDGLKDGEFKTYDRGGKLSLTQTFFKDQLFSEYKRSCNNK
jgi:antitoxin component YwqK of YwqJK toxin-antitoxin module